MSLKDDIENASKVLKNLQEKLPCEYCKKNLRGTDYIITHHSIRKRPLHPYYSLFCDEDCLYWYLQKHPSIKR